MGQFKQVEIVVHVDDSLMEEQRDSLLRNLRSQEGVEEVHFTPGRDHLLVVDYDQEKLQAKDVLGLIRQENLGAELIGPI